MVKEQAYSNSVEVLDKRGGRFLRRTSTLEEELQVWHGRKPTSRLEKTQLKETQLKETQLEETQLEETQLEETQLKETQLEETQVEKTYVRVIFGVLQAPQIPHDGALGSVIAPDFWTTTVKDLNGGAGSRYEFDDDNDDEFISHDTWSCFKIKQVQTEPKLEYTWQQLALFVKWRAIDNSNLVLTLDAGQDIQNELDRRLQSIDERDPYSWQVVFVEEVIKLYDKSVWSLRDLVRKVEKTRGSHCNLTEISHLHEISRHLGHSHETLDIAINIIKSISSEHEAFWNERKIYGDKQGPDKQVQRRLSSLSLELSNITRRSVSLKERLQYEINLAHNMVSHRNTDMMRTISAITLIYLPGTFVSGLFSSAFFQFSSETNNWVVAENFWVYWAIVIPLTITTFLIWAKYHRYEIKQAITFLGAKILGRKVEDRAKNP